ncbi:hypothetical protein ABTX81_31290 [Kitasatospora sp. NPDC097605]|uniref:hypothetical protein n=1 Tax=Kitasatospora sp. NPDC097605 TaxID=3157226 RepID=UPI00332CC409
MPEEQPPPNYRSHSWEDEATGARCFAFYPGDEEADDERKARLRAMAHRAFPDLGDLPDEPAEQPAENTGPTLRLIRGDGR